MPLPKLHNAQGYDHQPLPWSFWENAQDTDHLAIVFPGFGYHADLPVLYYPALTLFSTGADVARLEKRYNEIQGFQDQPDQERDRWLAADAAEIISSTKARRKYRRVTMIGKSLGTITIALCLEKNPVLTNLSCLWLTPVLNHPAVTRHLKEDNSPGIVAIGTRDPFYDPDLIAQLKSRQNLRVLVFPGADHSLEIDGDIPVSIHCMEELSAAIARFVNP